MVQGVSEEVHVASLHGRLREDLADGRAKAGVIVGDDELDAAKAAAAQGEQEVLPGEPLSRLAMTARIWRRPFQSMPTAISTAWLVTTPPSRTFTCLSSPNSHSPRR